MQRPRPSLSPASDVPSRRAILRRAAGAGIGAGLGVGLFGGPTAIAANNPAGAAAGFGPIGPPDANNLRLPQGFTSRVVATSNTQVASTGYTWHPAPDGGATFETGDGGWVYVSNAERSLGAGGVGAIRFDAGGTIVDAYSILSGTSRNCAGGPTPWGTWLSCEETSRGEVFECDPLAPGSQGVARTRMGVFQHEAAAVDPLRQVVYLTEDRSDGLLYRYVPNAYPDLSSGVLEAAEVLGGPIAPGDVRQLTWHVVPDPTYSGFTPTRYQVGAATDFDGGEGCWYEGGLVYFSTKGDNRVWKIDTATEEISIVYDLATSSNPVLSNVDNVYVSPCGDVYVAEDPGNLQIVALTPGGDVQPIMELAGTSGSEITGPALSPDGTRLYFSSQRNPGVTYEVTGPFLGAPGVPASGMFGKALTAAALATAGVLALRSRATSEGGAAYEA